MPPFHPDWIVNFWLGTPLLNKIDPHAMFIFLVAVAAIIVYQRRKLTRKQELDTDEKQFQLLLKKKAVIEERMALLTTQRNQEMSEELYLNSMKEYEQHLEKVKRELLRFT